MNPYFAYSISFLVALVVYSLGWSDAYPPLSIQLITFLIVSIVLFMVGGYLWKKKAILSAIKAKDYNPVRITLFIYFLWTAEFIYERGVPLFKILLKQPYDYIHFGIPTLHVFIVTFSSFYTIYLFYLFINNRDKKVLWLYCINLAAAFLIYNRGMFMFNLAASCIIYFHFRKINYSVLLLSSLVLILVLFLFGVVGNIRVANIDQADYTRSTFLSTGHASEDFKKSIIPKEFFWSYIYISSPLANLQENINHADRHSPNWSWFLKMVNNEMLPDFISKRINKWFKIPHPGEYRIERYFNVSTVYSISFSHQSWFGMIAMAIYLMIFPVVYIKLLGGHNAYQMVGIAILCTMYLFMAFDNTIRFTGLSFQLFYPLVLNWLEEKKWLSIRKVNL